MIIVAGYALRKTPAERDASVAAFAENGREGAATGRLHRYGDHR